MECYVCSPFQGKEEVQIVVQIGHLTVTLRSEGTGSSLSRPSPTQQREHRTKTWPCDYPDLIWLPVLSSVPHRQFFFPVCNFTVDCTEEVRGSVCYSGAATVPFLHWQNEPATYVLQISHTQARVTQASAQGWRVIQARWWQGFS